MRDGSDRPVLDVERPAFLAEEDLNIFAAAVDRFFDEHAPPEIVARWRENGIVDRDMWSRAGEAGLLGLSVPETYGGAGGDYRHEVILMEALAAKGVDGFGVSLHNAIVAPYIVHYGTPEQRDRWLPGICTGQFVTAIAMTEPGAGSDLQGVRTIARKEGGDYVISGQKTFITNGQTANLICVVAKTDPAQGARGVSLIFVETDRTAGFSRGRNLHKLGQEAQDTSELFFDEARVPAENLLGGDEGQGFFQLMNQLPQERLNIAVQGMGAIERALALTIDHVKQREAFGKRLIDFQNTQFKLAECKTEATVAKVFVYWLIEQHLQGKLDAAKASMAKYWVSDLENKIIDECLQLFGGWGYMDEYPISRMYRDSRVQRIYGGANEIMKVLIARTL
ncbi:MAG TPA: acyl-CoA dehydrogenase family protein [Caulobacteraceae bacterium]|nr:acyl-CoA dehydrogenase family protein [Caulobacteraceae bacterium]